MHHPSRHTLPSQSVQIRPLLPLLTSTLRVQGAIYVSTLQPEPPGLTSSLLDGGRHVPPQMSIMSTASCSCCRGPAVSHHTERNPEGPPVPWPRPPLRPHLLPLSFAHTFQACQPACWASNKPVISCVRPLCFAVSSLLFLLGEKALGSAYNSYLSGVGSFLTSQLLRDSILNTLSSKAFSLVSIFLRRLSFSCQYIHGISQY